MSTTYHRELHLSTGGDRLLGVTLTPQAAFAHHASNFWAVTIYHRKAAIGAFAADAIGIPLGSISMATRDLVALRDEILYSSLSGLAMADGDTIVADIVSTGAPAALSAAITPSVQRRVR